MNDTRITRSLEKQPSHCDASLRRGRTSITRSVHFSQPVSPDEANSVEDISKLNYPKEEQANYLHLVIAIFSLLVGCIAIGGCVMLYFELIQINTKVEMQKKQIFGNSKSQRPLEQGWIKYFQQQTDDTKRNIKQIKAWINTSACIEGNDFTTE